MTDLVPVRPTRRDPMREERLEILRLLEGGAVSADEAATLLDALDRADRQLPPAVADNPPPGGGRARQVRIRITEGDRERPTVNLAFPLGLVDAGLKIARKFAPDVLPNAEDIRESVTTGFRGHLLDVDEGGERVEIIVE